VQHTYFKLGNFLGFMSPRAFRISFENAINVYNSMRKEQVMKIAVYFFHA